MTRPLFPGSGMAGPLKPMRTGSKPLLKEEVFPGFVQKVLAGCRGARLLRREAASEVAFATIMWIDPWKM
jgi:hypothetical protein